MLGLIAIAATTGAVLYANIHLTVIAIAAIPCGFGIALILKTPTIRTLLFVLTTGSSCIIGAGLRMYADKPVPRVFGNREFEAVIVSVDRRLTETKLIVRDKNTRSKFQLSTTTHDQLLPGDVLMIHADIEEPKLFETTTGRYFNYPKYLKSKGIIAIAKQAKIETIKHGSFSPARLSTILRFHIADIFSRYLSFPIDGVIAGMTVGYQGGVPDTIQDLFRTTGVLHVLVLSGYNITMLAEFLSLILKWMSPKMRTLLTLTAIILLVLISGSGVASVRAGIMGSIALLTNLLKNKYQPLHALTIAYLYCFITSPLMIFYDPGFHLSFLATAFMLLAIPRVEQLLSFLPETKGINIRELLVLAISAPIFMLPYTMYFSGNFPLASPIANIVMAIVTPIFSLAAMLILCFSWLPIFAQLFGSLLSIAGSFVLGLLAVSNRLPQWNTPTMSWWVVLGIYVLVFYVLLRREVSQYFLRLQSYLQQPSSPSG